MACADTYEGKAFVFTWTVQNFSCCLKNTGSFLRSSTFVADDFPGAKWNLRLYPKGREAVDRITCMLWRSDVNDSEKVCVSSDVAFLTPKGSVIKLRGDHNISFETGYANFWVSEFQKEFAKFYQDAITLRCRLWKGETYPDHETHYLAVTKIEVERNYFEWTLEYCHDGKYSVSSKIENEADRNQLSIKSDTLDCNFLQLDFEMTPLRNEKADIFLCRLYLLDENRPQELLDALEIKGADFETKWEFSITLEWNDLVCTKEAHFDNDLIKLKAELISSYGVVISNTLRKLENGSLVHCPYKEPCDTAPANELLARNLWSFYQAGSFCDIYLKTSTMKFSAHSLVLIARSPVFKTMLTIDMLEKASETIDVSDLEDDVVQALLQYAYIGKVDLVDVNFAMKFYYAADKYQMLPLREELSAYLLNHLTSSNVSDVLILAKKHSDRDLQRGVEDFIDLHKVEVFSSQKWNELETVNPAFALEVIHKMYSD